MDEESGGCSKEGSGDSESDSTLIDVPSLGGWPPAKTFLLLMALAYNSCAGDSLGLDAARFLCEEGAISAVGSIGGTGAAVEWLGGVSLKLAGCV